MKNTLKALIIMGISLQGTAGLADQYYTLWIKAGNKGGYYLQTQDQISCPYRGTSILFPNTWTKCTLNEYGAGGGSYAQLFFTNQKTRKDCKVILSKSAKDPTYTFSSTCNGATFDKNKLYLYLL